MFIKKIEKKIFILNQVIKKIGPSMLSQDQSQQKMYGQFFKLDPFFNSLLLHFWNKSRVINSDARISNSFKILLLHNIVKNIMKSQ